MHKGLKFRTAKEAVEDTWLVPYPFDRVAQFTPEVRDREAAHLAQLDSLELLPEPLVRVQLRGIGRQTLQVDALRRAVPGEILTGVDEAAIEPKLRKAFTRDPNLPGDFVQDAECVAKAFAADPKIPTNMTFRFVPLKLILGGLA